MSYGQTHFTTLNLDKLVDINVLQISKKTAVFMQKEMLQAFRMLKIMFEFFFFK